MSGDIAGWFAGRVPDGWFTEPPEVTVDRDEIVVVGRIEAPEGEEAREGRIQRFREETRGARMRIADEAQRRFCRRVSWGVRAGDERRLFTHVAAPVLARLAQPERLVLQTLVDAGVAGSRSEAMAWCVRLVERNQADWLDQLRDALAGVEEARRQGPDD